MNYLNYKQFRNKPVSQSWLHMSQQENDVLLDRLNNEIDTCLTPDVLDYDAYNLVRREKQLMLQTLRNNVNKLNQDRPSNMLMTCNKDCMLHRSIWEIFFKFDKMAEHTILNGKPSEQQLLETQQMHHHTFTLNNVMNSKMNVTREQFLTVYYEYLKLRVTCRIFMFKFYCRWLTEIMQLAEQTKQTREKKRIAQEHKQPLIYYALIVLGIILAIYNAYAASVYSYNYVATQFKYHGGFRLLRWQIIAPNKRPESIKQTFKKPFVEIDWPQTYPTKEIVFDWNNELKDTNYEAFKSAHMNQWLFQNTPEHIENIFTLLPYVVSEATCIKKIHSVTKYTFTEPKPAKISYLDNDGVVWYTSPVVTKDKENYTMYVSVKVTSIYC